MSIAGIGLDLVEIARFKRLAQAKPRLIKRLFNLNEIEYAIKNENPWPHFAANFAVKEAFLKAIGTGLSDGIRWTDIVLIHNKAGKPHLVFRGEDSPALVSISHTETTAAAVVIMPI